MKQGKIELLFVITELYKGGAEVALINLLKSLDKNIYSVDLLIMSQKTNCGSLIGLVPAWVCVCNAGITNLELGFDGSETEFLCGSTTAIEFVSGKHYDMAFSYGEWGRHNFVSDHVDAKEKNLWIHTDITAVPSFNEKVFFDTFSKYRFYIFVSDLVKQAAIKKFPFLDKKAIVIHNILDQQELIHLSEEYLPDIIGAPWTNNIITVANIRNEKGYKRILATAKELSRRNFDFRWWCIGKFSDECLTTEILDEIKMADLSDKLILLGPKDNPYPYVKKADLFVLLSDYEAWPLATAEAMLLGVPALATATTGAKEHIRNNVNGILTSFDINDIANHIIEYFIDVDLRNSIKKEVKTYSLKCQNNHEFIDFIDNRLPERKAKMIERLDFDQNTPYVAVEAAIHLNRYAIAKPYCKGKSVLDVASGEGYGSFLLNRWGASHVEAIDIDDDTVKKAQALFGSEDVHFQCHKAEALPFESYSFDLITSFETIEHLEKPEEFLKEIKRVLKPGGVIILSCPNDPYYYKTEEEFNPFHKRKYTYFEYKDLVEKYLGNHVQYYLGFAADGFLNIPMTKSTEPSTDGFVAKKDMFETLNYTECHNALFIESDRYINHWNSNYYVGIWGADSQKCDINTVIYPREFFLELKDQDISLLKGISGWEKKEKKYKMLLDTKDEELEKAQEDKEIEIEALKEYLDNKWDEEVEALKQTCKGLQLESDRLSMMVDLVTKEKNALRENAYNNYNQFLQVHNEYEALQTELDIMKSTKGYKLLNLIYRFRCKIRVIFHKR